MRQTSSQHTLCPGQDLWGSPLPLPGSSSCIFLLPHRRLCNPLCLGLGGLPRLQLSRLGGPCGRTALLLLQHLGSLLVVALWPLFEQGLLVGSSCGLPLCRQETFASACHAGRKTSLKSGSLPTWLRDATEGQAAINTPLPNMGSTFAAAVDSFSAGKRLPAQGKRLGKEL